MFGEEFMNSNDKGTLKQYLCIENDRKRFKIVEAFDLADAREEASVWNAEVIKQITD